MSLAMLSLKQFLCNSLASGSVDGNHERFIKRISSIQKKNGPFEMVLCSGDFFSPSDDAKLKWKTFHAKSKSVDVPIYILGPSTVDLVEYYSKNILEDGGEVYPNVLYLGSKGVFKTSSGLTVAYMSGSAKKEGGCNFTKKDTDGLINQVKRDDAFQGVDILLTTSWPQDVSKYTKVKVSSDDESSLISLLALSLKPRYHISCHKEKFYERPPYRNHQVLREGMQHVSRFIALAPFSNTQNEKNIYAFSIKPLIHLSREELIKQPDDVTECPYTETAISSNNSSKHQVADNQFFFSKESSHKRKSDRNEDQRERKAPKGPPTLSSACWFCLGSKEVEKHLVISVGEKCYVALAKGALNEDHVLICPIMHYNSTVVSPDINRDKEGHGLEHNTVCAFKKMRLLFLVAISSLACESIDTTRRCYGNGEIHVGAKCEWFLGENMYYEKNLTVVYKECLRKMFSSESKHIVSFERNFYTQHLQLQIVGVPEDAIGELKDSFIDFAEQNDMLMIEVPEDQDVGELVAVTTPYFMVETAPGERLLHKVKGKMPLQFGREVLCSPSILNLQDRIDWKQCKVDKEHEGRQTKKFRERFKPFDFNFQ